MQKRVITWGFILKNTMNLFFIQLLKKKYWKLNHLIKIISLFTCLLIANHNWKQFFISLKNSDFKFSRGKQPNQNLPVISGSFLLIAHYSMKASSIVQGSSPGEVLKPPQKLFILERKLFLFPSADSMSRFAMQQLWKN